MFNLTSSAYEKSDVAKKKKKKKKQPQTLKSRLKSLIKAMVGGGLLSISLPGTEGGGRTECSISVFCLENKNYTNTFVHK